MFITLAEESKYEEEIKKSRFLVFAKRVESPEEALAYLDEVMVPDARHNCWAYKVGQAYRFDDDGEPSGSAGKRILAAIEQQGLDQVMVVVVRWFGGIKLGVGGLSRAYGGSASTCLREAEKLEVKEQCQFSVKSSFELVHQVHYLFGQFSVTKLSEQYESYGVYLEGQIDAEAYDGLLSEAENLCRGQLTLKKLD